MKKLIVSSALAVSITLTACSENISVETRLITAKNYLSENKVNESIIELKNAIRTDGKNGEARFLLGEIYLNQGDGAAAVKELERAFEFNYEMNKVLPLLARAYILTESDADVIALTETAGSLPPKEYSHYLAYKTLAEIRSEQMARAKDTRALAESVSGKNIYSFLASAYMAFAEQKLDEAESSVLKVLAIDPKQVDALMLQGQLSLISKDYNQAVESFKEYLNYQPKSGIAYIYLSESMLKAKRFDEAEKYADVILAKNSNQPYAHYIKAMVAFHRKDYYKASEHAEFALSSNFNQYALRLVAGASSFYLKNWESSHRHFSAIVDYLPKEHIGRRMLAITQLELGLIDELNQTVGDFESSLGDAELIDTLSYKLLELGAKDEARKLVTHNERATTTVNGNARKGFLKLMMNDPSGLDDLQEAVNLNPDFFEAELALAYFSLQNDKTKIARDIAVKWQDKDPDSAYSYNLFASIAIKEQNYEKAEELLQSSLILEPDNLFALLEQLKLAREQKDITLTQQRADYLMTIEPNNNAVLKQYFSVYHNEEALNKLQASYDANPADTAKAILLAQAMSSLKHYKKSNQILTNIADTPNLPKSYWKIALVNTKQLNESGKIQSILEQWMEVSPQHIQPVMLLTELHIREKNNADALSALNLGLSYNKGNRTLQLAKMQVLLNSHQIAPAKELYDVLMKLSINEALKQGFNGRILLLENSFEQAIPKLKVFYKAYPTSKNAIYVAQAYTGIKQESKAIEFFEQHATTNENAYDIKTILAGYYLKRDVNKAISFYEDILQNKPDKFIAHNNLAELYLAQNKTEKALQHAKDAYMLAPEMAAVADTYAKALFKSGDKSTALTYARKSHELSQGKNMDIKLNYVEILIANNEISEAKSILENVMPKIDDQVQRKIQLEAQL